MSDFSFFVFQKNGFLILLAERNFLSSVSLDSWKVNVTNLPKSFIHTQKNSFDQKNFARIFSEDVSLNI